MKLLFSSVGLNALHSVARSPALYAFDYDGTLSPIVQNSKHAEIPEETLALLRALSARAPVAIITGRRLQDLKQRLGFRPRYLVGNHGVEGLGLSSRQLREAISLSKRWTRQLNLLLAAERANGVEVENKKYSISIHYRRAKSRRGASAKIRAALKTLEPKARLVPGKCVVNVVPFGFPDKGTALLKLLKMAKLKSALYAGDDLTDENVFRLPNRKILTLRIGKDSRSRAKFYISRQSEINRVLKSLVQGLPRS
jgi:trehalose 6-phosphate phosphatase